MWLLKDLWYRLQEKVDEMSADTLSLIPMLAAVLVIFGLLVFYGKPFTGTLFENIMFSLIFFLLGTSGLPYIIRKDAPFFFSRQKGFIAEISGLIIVVSGWGIVIIFWARKIIEFIYH